MSVDIYGGQLHHYIKYTFSYCVIIRSRFFSEILLTSNVRYSIIIMGIYMLFYRNIGRDLKCIGYMSIISSYLRAID